MIGSRKVAIIGHFGGNKVFLDGQTVKTKILYDELKRSTTWEIIKVDTYYKKRNPLRLLYYTLKSLLTTKSIIVLLSGNGMRFYFPLLYYANKILGIRVYHDVIGGNLDKYVKENSKFRDYLNSFKVNWVETNGLKKKLIGVGINNCEVIPNFKRLYIVDAVFEHEVPQYRFRFCTFSRVMKEKGIEDAINAILMINKTNSEFSCYLDIYGPVDQKYHKRFTKIMEHQSEKIKYCGCVEYDKSTETLQKYDALLFPTFWKGEGFPGTIVDAFSAGVPVIASDWNCNAEIVENMIDGIIYPNDNCSNLEESILWFVNNRKENNKWKYNCVKKAKLYQPDTYIKKISQTIERDIFV